MEAIDTDAPQPHSDVRYDVYIDFRAEDDRRWSCRRAQLGIAWSRIKVDRGIRLSTTCFYSGPEPEWRGTASLHAVATWQSRSA